MDNTSQAVRAALVDEPDLFSKLIGEPLIRLGGGEFGLRSDPSLHINLNKGTYHDKSGKHGQGGLISLLQSWHGLPTYDAAGDMAREALGMRRWGDAKPLNDSERQAYAEQRQEAQAQRETNRKVREAHEAAEDNARAQRAVAFFEALPELPMGYALEDISCPAYDYLKLRGLTHETTGRHIDLSDVRTCQVYNFASVGEPREESPAILFAVRNNVTGERQGYQALAHTAEGHKATFPSGRRDKKSMGLCKGGAVYLSRWEEKPQEIGICEGVGDALAIAKRGFVHIRATLGLGAFPVLGWVQHLWIFPDRDDEGKSMAWAEGVARLWRDAGRDVTLKPAPMGKDWGDCV